MALFKGLIDTLFVSSDRLRELWIIDKLTKIKKNKKILDAGAGECHYKQYCKHLNYVSQDFGKYDGKGDTKGLQTGKRDNTKIDIISDITDIPVKSGSFDVVLCVEVFEHLPEPIKALKELTRVLKKNGVLILTAPFASLTHYSPYYYYSGFSINFYKELLPKYGFHFDNFYIYGNYFDYLAFEIIRTPIVCWRMMGFYAIPVFFVYLFALPFYIILRLLGIILPESKELLNYGICIKARKKLKINMV